MIGRIKFKIWGYITLSQQKKQHDEKATINACD